MPQSRMQILATKPLHKQCVREEGPKTTPTDCSKCEKDPAEHLVTVARRHREETLPECGKPAGLGGIAKRWTAIPSDHNGKQTPANNIEDNEHDCIEIAVKIYGDQAVTTDAFTQTSLSLSPSRFFPPQQTVSTTVSGSMGEAINPHPS